MVQQQQIRILLLDPIPEQALDTFKKQSFIIDTCFDELTEPQLLKRLSDYHIVCLGKDRDDVYLTDEVLRSAHKLLAIGIFGRFKQIVDIEAATAMGLCYTHKGIAVFTAPHQHQHSIVELVISNIVLLSRKIGDCSINIHNGLWKKVSDGCHEVRGKTLGIIGYGQIGSQLGVLAEALSLRVIFYDDVSVMPLGRAEPMNTLQHVLEQSDFVAGMPNLTSVNVSVRRENINFIGKKEIAQMKPGSYLLNASFSEAIDIEALTDALERKHLAGAALDTFPSVFHSEWPHPIFTRLTKQDNVILTPNVGDKTLQASERIGLEVANVLTKYVNDGSTTCSINFPNVIGWPLAPGTRRIVNVHRNVRGFLKEIDSILSSFNVGKQVLDTREGYGYLIADIATESVTTEVVSQLALLSNTVRTRIL